MVSEETVQVIAFEFIGVWNIAGLGEIVGLLWSREAYLRIACEVTRKRSRPAAWGTYQEEIRKPAGFGLIQNFTFVCPAMIAKPPSKSM